MKIMEDRLLITLIISCSIFNIINGYSLESKFKDRRENNEDNSWHKPREGGTSNEQQLDDDEEWTGSWMPHKPSDPTPPPKVLHQTGKFKNPNTGKHSKHVGMGAQAGGCDDGETNLRVDWDLSPVNYTCYRKKIVPQYSIRPISYCEKIPSSYNAIHRCMKHTIEYDDDIPLYGTHRPVWPVYGEYRFIPRQRWIHSLEHGAIVMLYHPCANPLEVKRLKTLVTGCLRRHVITPYTLLDEDRPLALVSWGCRLTMSHVNPAVVKQFIRTKALRGKEAVSIDGGFDEFLVRYAMTVTDGEDTTLCPGM